MSNQLVAGTVMLNSANGNKSFLVRENDGNFDFVTTTMNADFTNLASILKKLKTDVMVDVNLIDLVELTNISVNDKKMPLFVFEMEEQHALGKLGEHYIWETPQIMRSVLNKFSVSGVPIFQ